MMTWIRSVLVPQRAWPVSLVLLLVRLTLGVGLMDAGKGKVYALAHKCAEDPLPDCEKDEPDGNCAQLRAAECDAKNREKFEWFGTLTLFGHDGWKLPGGGKLNFALAGVTEAGAGTAMVLGVATRFVAVPAAVVMAVAMVTAHWGAFNRHMDFTTELAFLYFVFALVLLAMGPGQVAVDALLAKGGGGGGKAPKGPKAPKAAKPKK